MYSLYSIVPVCNIVYNSLLVLCLLGKSYGFSSGSFLFVNLVPANATKSYTNTLATS